MLLTLPLTRSKTFPLVQTSSQQLTIRNIVVLVRIPFSSGFACMFHHHCDVIYVVHYSSFGLERINLLHINRRRRRTEIGASCVRACVCAVFAILQMRSTMTISSTVPVSVQNSTADNFLVMHAATLSSAVPMQFCCRCASPQAIQFNCRNDLCCGQRQWRWWWWCSRCRLC